MNNIFKLETSISKETAEYLKEFCTFRMERSNYNDSKACRSCRYRYRGDDPGTCCMFGDVPWSWDIPEDQ